jgi:chemotaxis protein MotA
MELYRRLRLRPVQHAFARRQDARAAVAGRAAWPPEARHTAFREPAFRQSRRSNCTRPVQPADGRRASFSPSRPLRQAPRASRRTAADNHWVAPFKGSKFNKDRYMELLSLMYDLLQKVRKEGLMSIEKDVEDPHSSAIFQKYPNVGNDHHVTEFITDYLRMMVSGNLNAHEIESLMDQEIDTHHQEEHAAVAAIARLAGGLPAFGIVAAVLGVVNTMGSVGQPPAVLGGMIGSALVGTFLGILLAYGFVEPLGGLLEQKVEDAGKEFQCIKATLLASMQGYAPQIAIEFGRKVLYSGDRPSFSELEAHLKKK